MTLAHGSHFSSYQILGPLGVGGMGEVYRATDLKLKREVADAHYLSSGHLLYALGDGLFARAFDPAALKVSGGALPVTQHVLRATPTASSNYGVSANGSLFTLGGRAASPLVNLVWVDRAGIETVLPVAPGNYVYPRLSPDGTRVALNDRITENAL